MGGVLLIERESFKDARGEFLETYNKAKYKEHGIAVDFLEDDISVSVKDVLRGIHGNEETWKLVSCLHGKVLFTVVNCDRESAEFGMWESFDLNDANHTCILVPPMHGSAYLALTDKVIFQYKQSAYYNSQGQFTYRFDDPKFGIRWPIKNPILAPRDAVAKYIDAE